MGRPKKQSIETWEKTKDRPGEIQYNELDHLEEGFKELIATDPKYSLEPDPEGKYHFSNLETEFIKWMVQYKNVQFVATVLMNIPLEGAVAIYKRYDVQNEIKRINTAMYARRFATKMADLDEIGGLLTSAIIDENVPVAERLSPKDKLSAMKLLITVNTMKKKGFESPAVIEAVEIQKDLDKLSPNDLKQLIAYNDEDADRKEKLISLINEGSYLSMEELKNLRMMSVEELENLADTIVGGLEEDGEEDE